MTSGSDFDRKPKSTQGNKCKYYILFMLLLITIINKDNAYLYIPLWHHSVIIIHG